MKKFFYGLAVLLSVFLLWSCTTDSDGDTSISAMTETYLQVTEKLEDSQSLAPGGSEGSALSWFSSAIYADPLDQYFTVTTDVGIRDPEDSGDILSIKAYLDTQFDPQSLNENGAATNMMGRINNAMQVFCAIGVSISDLDADGYPEDGEHVIELSEAVLDDFNSECGVSFEGDSGSMLGSVITMNVEAPDDTSLFDKAMYVEMPANTSTFNFYLRYSEDDINVATSEKNLSGDNEGHEYRTSVLYDLDAETMRAEYLSVPANNDSADSVYFYRMYMDDTTTYALVWESGDDDDYKAYSGAGETDDLSSTAAVSFAISADANESGDAFTDLNGCVNRDLGSISSTTDTLSCDTSLSTSDQAASDIISLVSSILSAKTTPGWNVISLDDANINFSDESDLYSASPDTL